MPEFLISGPQGPDGLYGVALASILPGVVVPVSGTFTIGSIGVSVGTVVVGTIASPVVVATVLNAPLVTVQGTVSTSVSIGSISVGTITVGTILSPLGFVGTIATVQSLVGVGVQQQWYSSLVLTNAAVASSGAATLQLGSLQALVVDYVFGTVVAGSILAWVGDVEQQTGVVTGTALAATWHAGTVQSGHRLVVQGPLGYKVAVAWTVAAGGTLGAGTVTQVFITATPSEGT